jgi:DNA-binding transcriptional ArsR family regulator
MRGQAVGSVQRLIELGICQPSDIKRAKEEAEKFSNPDYTVKIRKAERLLGAAGDSTRIKILLLLSEREMCVCELESALDLTQPTASHHLGVLEQADLVERSKRERWVFYKVRNSPTLDLLKSLVSR